MEALLGWGDGGLEGDMGLGARRPPVTPPGHQPTHTNQTPSETTAWGDGPLVGVQSAGWPVQGALADDVEVEVEDGLARTGSVVDHDAVVFEAGVGGDPLRDEQQVAE